MCQNGGWTPFARKKVLDTPSLNATLTRHAILGKKYVRRADVSEGWVGSLRLQKRIAFT